MYSAAVSEKESLKTVIQTLNVYFVIDLFCLTLRTALLWKKGAKVQHK